MKYFTLFGNPVEHSISPELHNSAFKKFKIEAKYSKTLLEDGSKLGAKFLELDLSGANVTVPHKEAAYKLCDEIIGIARKIEAVNTVVKKDGKLVGFNTDAGGFLLSIEEFGNINSALILGAGGTAKAIAFILQENNIHTTVINRSKDRLLFFKNSGFETFAHADFSPKSYDLVINTTSAGLKDSNLPIQKEILEKIVKDAKFGFDVIYGKQTPFLTICKDSGLIYKDGMDMLLYQAALAFNIFFDNTYDEIQIVKIMRSAVT